MTEYKGVQGGKYYCVQTMPQFMAFMELLVQQPVISIDTETSGLDWVKSHACGIVVGWGVEHNYYLPIDHLEVVDEEVIRSTEKQLDIDAIRPALREVFEDATVTKLLHNAKFDLHFLRKLGLEVKGIIHDTVILVHLLDENTQKSLKYLANKYIDKNADKWEVVLNNWRVTESRARRSALSEKMRDYLKLNRVALEAEFFKDKPFISHSTLTKAQVTAQLKGFLREKYKDHVWAKNKKDDISYDYVPLDIMVPYACADVHYTWLVYKMFVSDIAGHPDLKKLYINEMALANVLFEVEHKGVQLDIPYLENLEPDFAQDIAICEQEIYTEVGYTFNINSGKELTKALLSAGCVLTKMTKKSKDMLAQGIQGDITYSVDKSVLEGLATTHPFAAKVQNARLLKKLKNTYVVNLRKLADDMGFLHSTINQNVSTGRMSSRDPNVQNIPGRNNSIRRAFITPLNMGDVDDWVYVFIDYSQVELRLTAHHSQDPEMLKCYPFHGKGIDIHTLTCAEVIMDIPYAQAIAMKGDFTGCCKKTVQICPCPGCTVKFFRDIAKRVNFGIIYGAGPGAIQRQVSRPERPVTEEQCAEYIEKYLDKYQGVKEWIMVLKAFLRKHGYVQNTFGRYRRLPDIKCRENWKRERAARQGGNFMIQGDAADLFKTAAVRVYNLLKNAGARTHIVNFVHDELQFYWHRSELHLLSDVKRVMEDFDFSVPIVAEVSYSTRDWANKKEL